MAKGLAFAGAFGIIYGLILLAVGLFYIWAPIVTFTYVVHDSNDHKERRDYALQWGSLITIIVMIGLVILGALLGGGAYIYKYI